MEKELLVRGPLSTSNNIEIGAFNLYRFTIGYNSEHSRYELTMGNSSISNTLKVYTDNCEFDKAIHANGGLSVNGNLTVNGRATLADNGRCTIYSYNNQNGFTIHDLATQAYIRCENGGFEMQNDLYVRGPISSTDNISAPNITSMNNRITALENRNTTITHYAPIEGKIEDFKIGFPVFMTGKVYNRINNEWIKSTLSDRTDCICSVCSTGDHKTFAGIITDIDKNNRSLTFATHGDFMFNVDDSTDYEIGDVILYNGMILDENITLTLKHQRSIVGVVSAIVDDHTVAIFRE